MKLKSQIILTIFTVSIFGIFLVYYTILSYNSVFQDTLGQQTAQEANSVIYEIDREIYESVQTSKFHASSLYVIEEIQKSNSIFDNLSNTKDYINKIDQLWIANSNETSTFVQEILNNKGSIRLKDIKSFYSKENGLSDYPEIFVTNKYGTLVSSTGRTSDYRQNDEEWWLKAKEKGVYIEEPSYDDSSKSTGLTIATKIKDKQGDFIGVIKEVVSDEKLIRIIDEASNNNNISEIKLLSKYGDLIYHSNNTPHTIEDLSNYSFFKKLNSESGYLLTKKEWDKEDKNQEIILSYAKSQGHKDFNGFGWIVLIENNIKQVMSPAVTIKRDITILSGILSFILILAGILFSSRITNPIKIMTQKAKEISKGNFSAEIKIKSKDEVGELASSFNAMTTEINKSRNQLEEANKNLEEKVSQRTKELDGKNKELEKFNKLTVGRELEMMKLKDRIKELEAKSEDKKRQK